MRAGIELRMPERPALSPSAPSGVDIPPLTSWAAGCRPLVSITSQPKRVRLAGGRAKRDRAHCCAGSCSGGALCRRPASCCCDAEQLANQSASQQVGQPPVGQLQHLSSRKGRRAGDFCRFQFSALFSSIFLFLFSSLAGAPARAESEPEQWPSIAAAATAATAAAQIQFRPVK